MAEFSTVTVAPGMFITWVRERMLAMEDSLKYALRGRCVNVPTFLYKTDPPFVCIRSSSPGWQFDRLVNNDLSLKTQSEEHESRRIHELGIMGLASFRCLWVKMFPKCKLLKPVLREGSGQLEA